MKSVIIGCLVLFNVISNDSAHDAITAKFHLVNRGEVLFLEIDFSSEDFILSGASESLVITKEDVDYYIKDKTRWSFNKKEIIPKVLSVKQYGHHTKAVCFISKTKKHLKSIEIKNEFLLNIENHSNIIILDVNDTHREFRLHSDRKKIKINL